MEEEQLQHDVFRFDSHYKFFSRPGSSINQVGSLEKLTDTTDKNLNSQIGLDEYNLEEIHIINETMTNEQTNTQNETLRDLQSLSVDSQINSLSPTEPFTNKQTLSTNEQELLPKANSFATVSISDFELNNLDKTPSPPPTFSIKTFGFTSDLPTARGQ
ncbi:unnamed protein product [Adineta ricciae]|uniref:Uncharacterized protein n=1 Tax=Adineta ricciae TaxID=249248 RepID=A0A814PS53_ADIRI|nr:unnamed protein product [Adineta ricciae]